ncbi:MAG: Rieske 2Fe-2S domain-containing protein [Ignavibacteria bacterium]|nr:Rieske 2Fe-2S domain-containing protein [Ignavibacteria bacterium]
MIDRRDILKLLFTAIVTTPFFPHKILGKITPDLKQKGDSLLGIYGISLIDYPDLQKIWGSVRIKIQGTLMFYPKVIIVRVPKEEYNVEFIAISERCPHEGFIVKDFDPELKIFECPGHGTLFDVTGKYVWGPAARDLERIQVEYNGTDTIYLEIPLYPHNVEDLNPKENLNINLIRDIVSQEKPTIEFQMTLETVSNIKISLYDSLGRLVSTLFEGNTDSRYFSFPVSYLKDGIYFLRLFLNNQPKITKKIIIAR